MKILDFKNGIFSLNTRRFGSVAEVMIEKLYKLSASHNISFDRLNPQTNEKVEIKFSRVLKANDNKINGTNIITECINANFSHRILRKSDISHEKFDCNIQQIKRKNFDVLYYGLFFIDVIQIFRVKSINIENLCPAYSNFQHAGNIGEGQFHINNETYPVHISNNFIEEIDYNYLYNLFE